MRLRKTLKTMFGVLGALVVILTVWLFLVLPRVVNQLADLLGQMGTGDNFLNVDLGLGVQHFIVATVISLPIFYFFIWQPTRQLKESLDVPGLLIRKGEGVGYVDTESVRQQIFAAISKFTDIKRAEVNVENDAGRALIRMNIITDILLNGPQKKNEINREVRKIVQDQLGIDIEGKPMISFSLSPLTPDTPLITSGSGTTPASSSASYSEPVIESPMAMGGRMPPPEDEPDVEVVDYQPSGPSGIDLARSDPFSKTRTEPMIEPIPSEDDATFTPRPGSLSGSMTDSAGDSSATSTTTTTDEDRDQLASQG